MTLTRQQQRTSAEPRRYEEPIPLRRGLGQPPLIVRMLADEMRAVAGAKELAAVFRPNGVRAYLAIEGTEVEFFGDLAVRGRCGHLHATR